MTEEKPLDEASLARSATASRGIVGARLAGVTYHYLVPRESDDYVGGGQGLDADLVSVVLDLGERGCQTITWAMGGRSEGLVILRGSAPYPGLPKDLIDVSSKPSWARFIGERVVEVGAAMHVADVGAAPSVWALRLGFDVGAIVVALGTVDDEFRLAYAPDELVVVFDEVVPKAYRPRHADQSAWGRSIGADSSSGRP